MVEDNGLEERMIEIDRERCVRCGECLDVCPQTVNAEFPVYVRGEEGFPQVSNIESCIGCLSCEVNCRAMALRVRGASAGEAQSMREVRAEAKDGAMF